MPAERTQSGPQLVKSPAASNDAGRVVGIDSGDHRERLRKRRDELVEQYAGMVRPIAERIKLRVPDTFDLDDLIQEGMIGLMYAATRFQPEEHDGTPFTVYARHRIVGAILDAVSGRNWHFAKMGDPLPDPNEAPHLEPGSNPDFDEVLDARAQLRQAEDAIATLDGRSQRILTAWFGETATLERAGRAEGVSRQCAGDVRDRAIAKVRTMAAQAKPRAAQPAFTPVRPPLKGSL